jgi:hypothetical protein
MPAEIPSAVQSLAPAYPAYGTGARLLLVLLPDVSWLIPESPGSIDGRPAKRDGARTAWRCGLAHRPPRAELAALAAEPGGPGDDR